MALFADANIILELLLPQRPKTQKVEELLEGKAVSISMLTVHLSYHFGAKQNYSIERIKQALSGYNVMDVTGDDYQDALRCIRDNDFEDALQLAVALRSGCDAFATLDKAFAKTYGHKMRFIVP